MFKILLAEDDKSIQKNLSCLLAKEGFSVIGASGQKEALEKLESEQFDLALLDLALADGSGYAVCSAIKKRLPDLPVIFLTASDDEISVVTGLDMGADDYITKPFRPMELVSRIKSVLRRSGKTQSVFEIRDIKIDTVKGKVYKNETELFLSALEYRLLLAFINNRGVILTREKLLNEIWDLAGEYVNDNTLTVYIKRLREKLGDDAKNPEIIKTVRGLGYRMDA
ncbi:MAG TPA: response regulator transcription factor [Bacillota bacterium]|nr:response regulator transcription factor [Bacillota bacterium]HOK69791.1 response regulator transcription factor [Bacillota bacterium]HPP86176.1 response regulator transcription factor [Bacillota bacterium]